LATGTKVSSEALATSFNTESASRARLSALGSSASHGVGGGGAHLDAAVRAGETLIANTGTALVSISSRVSKGAKVNVVRTVTILNIGDDLGEGLAYSVSRAIVGALGTLASVSGVSIVAHALSSLSITYSSSRAFEHSLMSRRVNGE